jgi:hypothetical protein
MRAARTLVAIFVAVSFLSTGHALGQSPADPADIVLAASRQALGGADRLASIRSFVATGRTRQVQGNNLVAIELQLAWEAPDKFVRTDEFPAQDREPVTTGFDGARLIQTGPPARQGTPATRGNPPPPGRGPGSAAGSSAPGATVKHDVTRLMLGLFAGAVSPIPLSFRYAGLAEAPQGQADVLEATGPDAFSARFFVDKATHLPVMVTWEPAPSMETRLYFADYRTVDGLTWPFRLRRAVGSEPAEETNFDGFRVNAKIDPRRFEVK